MSLTLVLGPARAGKTGALIERAAARYRDDPFAATLVLVPTSRHADQFRRRLVAEVGAAFSLEVATLSGWSRGFVTAGGGRVATRAIAAELLARAVAGTVAAGSAPAFAPIAATPGLLASLAEAGDELLGEAVAPAAFAGAADRCGERAGLTDLGAVYAAFVRAAADAGFVLPASAASAAAMAVRDGLGTLAPLVLLDGFDFLREGEVQLVAALAGRCEVLLALDPAAGARAAHAHARLLAAVPGAETVDAAARPPAREQVAFSASDREAELRAIARDIKERLTSDRRLRPSDFAVAFRQVTPSLPLARDVFREYDLPLDPAAGFALEALPFGTWVRRLLRLGIDGWKLRDLVAVLRPAFMNRQRWGLDRGHVAAVARYGRENHLWAGLDALRGLASGLARAGEERDAAAGAGLERLLTGVAPLLDGSRRALPGTFARDLEQALFGPDPIVRPATEARAEIDAFRELLRSRIEIDEALGGVEVSFSGFVAVLLADMERPALLLREAGGVTLAPLHSLHGLRFQYLAIGGLAEGEFPAPRRTPALLDTEARAILAAEGLTLPAGTRATEEELFAAAASRADATLVLTRPRWDADGRPRAASHFFPVETVEEKLPRTLPERAASRSELALALVRGWPEETRAPREFEAWETVRRTAAIEGLRRSFESAGLDEGRLPRNAAARLLAPDVEWSATRFETYITCAFAYFAQYGLGVRKLDAELQEADAATLGTVVHEIVEAAVRPLVAAQLPLTPATLAPVLERVRTDGRAMWESAPQAKGFGRAGLWGLRWPRVQARIQRMLAEEAEESRTAHVERVEDVESKLAGAQLALPHELLSFGGKIDRLDRGPELAVIVDYKTGRFIPAAEVRDAQKIQLQLYAAAVRARSPEVQRVVARFAYLRPTRDQDRVTLDSANPADAAIIDAAVARAAEVRQRIDAGHFEVMPGPFRDDPSKRACPSYCPFKYVCRVTPLNRWKQWD